ncbi:ornithine cyclodeaminase family protein [Streptomyces olindensis]|uniref:Ornithine cyclodeaminase family protein n=1 Tax=Streptomyces olindensis TaxID=358823 RepID=A0ABV2XPL6_9ACTN
MLKLLDATTIRDLTSVSDLAAVIGEAFVPAQDGSDGFVRSAVQTPGGQLLFMPAAHGATLSVKLVSLFDGATAQGLPSVQGLAVVFDAHSGRPLALMDATALTALRTAAVTTLATDLLARRDARTLAVIGAGVQGRSHLEGLAGIRLWDSVRLHSRDMDKARRLAEWARGVGIEVELHDSVESATEDADVICTVTSAVAPLFTDAFRPRPGAHISAVGAYGPARRELPSRLVADASLFVESTEAVLREAGDILIPIAEGLLPPRPAMTELSAVLSKEHPGRTSAEELTLFESVGIPTEDALVCDLLYRRAVQARAGRDIPF